MDSFQPAISVQDRYLTAIYKLQRHRKAEPVGMGDLAHALGVAPGTATAMVKRLSQNGLLHYLPYQGAKLTALGRTTALKLVRRHRLLECFLIASLNYEWSDVHADAEMLELGVSDRLLERIDAQLGHPTADPHGNPIPTADGKLAQDDAIPLSECHIGSRIQFIRIGELSPDFLDLLAAHGWRPGCEGLLNTNDPIAETVTITAHGAPSLTMGRGAAHDIFVEVL